MTRSITWFPNGVDPANPDGSEIVLQGDNTWYEELVGASGYGAATYTATWGSIPGFDGGYLDSVSVGISDESWRFLLRTDTPAQFRAAYRELVKATNPKRGLGTFQVGDALGEDAGNVRQIKALCVDGLRGDSVLARGEDTTEWPFSLQLQHGDPNWYSLEPTVATWTGRPGVPFFPRKFPYVLALYGVIVGAALDLDGDTESWPAFTLSGPWTRVKFIRDSTGEAWEITRGQDYLTETLVMNTDPRVPQGPRTLDGQSRYSWLDFTSTLFPLSPGDTVSVEADGVTSETLFSMSVVPAWLTAP